MTPPMPDAEMVERIARAMMDSALWKGAFDNALMYGGQESEREVWRGYARVALAALDLPIIRAEAHRAGMEAMRDFAFDAKNEHDDCSVGFAMSCLLDGMDEHIRSFSLDPIPAANGEVG